MRVRVEWRYTMEHRYESDMDEMVRVLVRDLCEAVPAQHVGSSGGTSFMGEILPSDSSHTFDVPNAECAEQIWSRINAYIKTWDPAYEARLHFEEV